MAKSDEIQFQGHAIRDLMAKTSSDQMDNKTPCAKWNTRDLMNHLVGGATWIGGALRGDAPDMPGDSLDLVGDDPIGAWDQAFAVFAAGVDSDGAMEREIQLPMGAMPGAMMLEILKFDVLVHAWDLARATGQEFDPPAEVTEPALATARQMLQPEMRDGDRFAPEQQAPSGATPIEQLAAFTGRTV